MIAPVLAGETLKSAAIQYRAMSSAITNVLAGWWLEYQLYYCPLSVLPNSTAMRTLVVEPSATVAGSATVAAHNHQLSTRPDYVDLCLQAIVRAYYRDEGQDASDYVLDGRRLCAVTGSGWWDSVSEAADLPTPSGSDDWERQWSVWSGMRRARLTTATYPEWLAMHGVSTPPDLVPSEADLKVPELIRFVRDYAYPVPQVQTLDDGVGGFSGTTVAATVQWSQAERVNRSRFFAEPGFLVGIMTVRPKAIHQNVRGNAVDWQLHTPEGWMQPMMDTDPHTAIVEVGTATVSGGNGYTYAEGPIVGASSVSGPYWFDRRDLLLHGDQFHDMGQTTVVSERQRYGLLSLPAASATGYNLKYPPFTTTADLLNFLFMTQVGGGLPQPGVDVDGITLLSIASRISTDVT